MNIVIVSACDENQAKIYRQECKRLEKKYPLEFVVLLDDWNGSNARIGSGGSLLQVCNWIIENNCELSRCLLIPAGGYSKRLPHLSACGKAMLQLPNGMSMLECKVDLHWKMSGKPGLLVVGSDTIELMPEIKESFPEDGITAFAHPSSFEVGRGHGVFNLGEVGEMPMVTPVKEFLHKPPLEDMKKISRNELVWTDSCFWIPDGIIPKLAKLYQTWSSLPICTELEAYGDFLGACKGRRNWWDNTTGLVDASTGDYVKKMRLEIQRQLEGTPLYAYPMYHSRFIHLGTVKEYLYHITNDQELAKRFGWTTKLNIVERSLVKKVGKNSIISGVIAKDIPDNVYIFTIEVEDGFVTFKFGLDEDFKSKVWYEKRGIFSKHRKLEDGVMEWSLEEALKGKNVQEMLKWFQICE